LAKRIKEECFNQLWDWLKKCNEAHELMASSSAIRAVKNKTKESMADAEYWVTKHQERQACVSEFRTMLSQLWPFEEEVSCKT
jgi:hypothetical protein